jgi:nitrile hydratase
MGGFTGFGAVTPERDERVFHEEWEGRVFALVQAVGSIDGWPNSRPFRESLPALEYWGSSYYEIWLEALILALAARGTLNVQGRTARTEEVIGGAPSAAAIADILRAGSPENRTLSHRPQFAVGDNIETRNTNAAGHTRLPRYARGRRGKIVAVHGAFAYPESQVCGLGDDPQWLYSVCFSASELWGRNTRDIVYLDLWEPYLSVAGTS